MNAFGFILRRSQIAVRHFFSPLSERTIIMTSTVARSTALTACLILTMHGNAFGTVTTVGLWRLGDDDGGAVAGGAGNATSTAAVGPDLTARTGSPLYSSDTPGGSSSLSMDFDLGEYYNTTSGSLPTTADDNFGIEAWVKRDSVSGDQGIAWNGTVGGWALLTRGTDIVGHLSGVGDVGTGGTAISTGEWFHAALVRDSGVSTLYLNGIANGTTNGGTPTALSGSFWVGQIAGAPSSFDSDGKIDHVRVFTFAAGEFDPATDLTLSLAAASTAPEPSTIILALLGFLGVLASRRRRRRG